jgi:hypothetical protein
MFFTVHEFDLAEGISAKIVLGVLTVKIYTLADTLELHLPIPTKRLPLHGQLGTPQFCASNGEFSIQALYAKEFPGDHRKHLITLQIKVGQKESTFLVLPDSHEKSGFQIRPPEASDSVRDSSVAQT